MGLATARLLATRGAIISLADTNQAGLLEVIATLSGGSEKHMIHVMDVRQSTTVDSWIEATVKKFGKLDGAVNMAGIITPAMPITEMTDESWDFTFDVNARGVFSCLRAQLRAISEGGSIVCLLLPCGN